MNNSQNQKDDRKMKFYKISPKGLNSVIDKLEKITIYLEESVPGDIWKIEVLEMTEKEFLALPESDGF